MTKKDYIKASEIVRKDRLANGDMFSELMMLSFIRLFQNDNPRFDERRFREACNKDV